MSGMWDRTLVYLGLREEPDEAYDDLPEVFDPEHDPHAAHQPARRPVPVTGRSRWEQEATSPPPVTAVPRDPAAPEHLSNVRPLRVADPVGGALRVAVVEITEFDEVESVGARYRTGQAVLFDLAAATSTDARRVVDFVAGLTYALRGSLIKVGSRAFLLVPDGVEVADDERRRLEGLGYRLPAVRGHG